MSRLLALLLMLIAVSVVGCSGGPVRGAKITAARQSSASKAMGISFPPETKFLLYHRASDEESFLPAPDDFVHLKIELPAAVATKLLAEKPFAAAEWDTSLRAVNDSSQWHDWKPEAVKKFRSAQIELPHAQALNVLVDEDDKERTIIFLQWFDT
jgi:hypothetical protein